MPKSNIFIDVFQGEHITIMLKAQQEIVDEEGAHIGFTNMMTQGILVEADDEFIYLTPDLQMGINEALRRSDILRVVATDSLPDDRLNIPEPPKDRWN